MPFDKTKGEFNVTITVEFTNYEPKSVCFFYISFLPFVSLLKLIRYFKEPLTKLQIKFFYFEIFKLVLLYGKLC